MSSSYIGYYTNIKNQGGCGSCWAYSCVGQLEGLIKKAQGKGVNLSEQFLLSCNSYGYSCKGWHFTANNTIVNDGLPGENCYPYVGYKAKCKHSCVPRYASTGWAYVASSGSVPDVTAIKMAIYQYGSVSAAVAADKCFMAYKSGIFDRTTSTKVNHAVLLVGWDDSKKAWILKNS